MNNPTPLIGKNILELLTTGMYDNPLIIFREYIQNSVDAINSAIDLKILSDITDGEINILINQKKHRILISDNATGIPANDAWRILTSVAASEKNRHKDIGFRGIGRLAGLAYCSKLRIETSFKGEDKKTCLEWDGEKLKKIIQNKTNNQQAHEVIESITLIYAEPESIDQHYFKVELQGVKKQELLDIEEVKKYLKMVAPVPFSPQFLFNKAIKEGLQRYNLDVKEYVVFVNNDRIFKPYGMRIYQSDSFKNKKAIDDVIDVLFFEIKRNEQIFAVGWYGLTEKVQLIPVFNEFVGIRLRKGNIQIGDMETLQKFFDEKRFHKYFFGEIHVVSTELLPNGQRDYLDESDILVDFQQEMIVFSNSLKKLCRDASEMNSSITTINEYSKVKDEFIDNSAKGAFVSPSHEKAEKTKLEKAKEKADSAQQKIEKIQKKASDDDVLKKLVKRRLESLENSKKPTQDEIDYKSVKKYRSNNISTLSRKEQKLVGQIYDVIQTILTPDLADNLIAKIEDRLNNIHGDKQK